VGCDQVIALAPSRKADAFMRIWNADGGEVEACGNAARCVAWLLTEASGRDEAMIETSVGVLGARRVGERTISIDMGPPGLEWRDIPLAWEMDTREVRLTVAPTLGQPGCVSMGNPHAVFFVPDADEAPVEQVGPIVETHWLFPKRANVGFAQILAPDRIRLRVWERGVGLTQACGTGACAALVAAHRRGLMGRSATLMMDGGELAIEWRESDDHVLMTGPVAVEFTGHLPAMEAA
jgi:diaminopimelate epimerase